MAGGYERPLAGAMTVEQCAVDVEEYGSYDENPPASALALGTEGIK